MGDMLNVPDTVPTGSSTGSLRNKVALKKGRGLMDWVRLGHSAPDLAGTGGKALKITMEELGKHNTREDAWMALKGNVYNVTPYFEYHPGGEEELMKGVGIDATDLFNEVHKWVNYSTMLQKCFVGTLVESKSFFSKPNFLPLKKLSKALDTKKDNNSTSLSPPPLGLPSLKSPSLSTKKAPPSSPLAPPKLPAPKYDWFQTKTLLNIAIYSKWKEITLGHVVIENAEKAFKAVIRIQDQVFTIHVELFRPVERAFEVKIGNGCGKVDVLLKKALPGVRWTSLGRTLRANNELVASKSKEISFLSLSISEKVQLTHNTFLYVLDVPEHLHFGVPIGHHVFLRIPESGTMKPYTPVVTPFKVGQKGEDCTEKNIQIYFKVYDDGELTPLLGALSEGDELDVSLPEGTFSPYDLRRATCPTSHLALLGAGTGITPHLKLMLEALKQGVRTTLITFNKTEEDIPWKVELDSLVVSHSKCLRVFHVLSRPSESWGGLKGHVRKEVLEELLPTFEDEVYFCVCGTTGFTKLTLDILEDMAYPKENAFAFTG